jgi:hypothetical protein
MPYLQKICSRRSSVLANRQAGKEKPRGMSARGWFVSITVEKVSDDP